MKSLFTFLALLLASVVSAISSSGDRLLAVFDDVADKAGYSKFLGDLESLSIQLPQLRLWGPIYFQES